MKKGTFPAVVLAALLAIVIGPAVAEVPVDQSPLIVDEPLPPNIILMYDDSGSMYWSFLPDDIFGHKDTYRAKSSAFNGLYYDPEVEYLPPQRWHGGRYPDSPFDNAPKNGFDPDSTRVDLSQEFRPTWYYPKGSLSDIYFSPSYTTYYINNEYAGGPERAYYYIFTGTQESQKNYDSYYKKIVVDSGEEQNFANWYSYYRTRELAAKSGIMNAFAQINPDFRVGFGSINNGASSYIANNASQSFVKEGKRLAGVERFGSDDQVGVQRKKLWDWLEMVNTTGGTPLRISLKAVGEYYDDENQPWESGYDDGNTYSGEIYSCRQSYAILLTDGYWNGNDPGVGNADGSDGSELVSADGKDTFKYEPKDPFEDDYLDTLADVAMEYWKRDLRPGDDENKNDVPTTGRDPGFWQHMTTFTIGLGVEPSGIEPADATIPAIFDWARTGTEPTSFDANDFDWGDDEIADLAHAAVNGHGGFYSAADPQEFARGLSEALAAIDNATGAGNSVSLSGNASEVVKDGSLLFVGNYVTGEWSGRLEAFSYSSDTGEFDTEEWSAAAQMPAAADRNIWTTDGGAVVEFKAGELSDDPKTALSENIATPFAVPGADIVAYLRGDRSYEDAKSTPLDSTLRQRASLLGDIVSSTPVPVDVPEPKASAFKFVTQDFEGLDEYADFVTTHEDREPMVYIAANDGMLHAFRQSTGEETFAFLPGSLLTAGGDASLARYANPQYGVYDQVSGKQEIPHQYYNDGEMTTENVFIGDSWKTVLVGTTGRGPTRTVYALDVTDPSVLADPAKAADAVLWEHSAADGGDYEWIGQVLGRPTIWQVPDNGNKTKWVALIGNGPNSGDDEAALLQFDLADGRLEVIGTNNDKNNGLAAPTVVMTDPGTGIADYAFAGDLRGNVWQFDLDKGKSEKVFEAVGPDGDEQPITARMNATAHPNDGSIWLFFGTGRFLAEEDIDRREVQSLYGLRVQARTSGKPEVDKNSTRRGDLVERSIEAQRQNGDLIERATEQGGENDLNPDKAGWYMDLIYDNNAEGERILNIAQLVAWNLYVTTMIPIAGDPCNALPPGATMILDPFSGANPELEFLSLDGYGNLGSIGDIPVNAYISKVGAAGALTFAMNEAGELVAPGQDLSGEPMSGGGFPVRSGGATRLNWQELYVR